MKHFLVLCCFMSYNLSSTIAQENLQTDSNKVNVVIKGLLQTRFIMSVSNGVDVSGLHHINEESVNNTFDIKRARIQVTSKISEHVDVNLLLNMSDFKLDPKNKVLENASFTYQINPYVNFRMGQFRPAFGLEDMYPVDMIKSMDYSNQYTAFGNNGWQSFQIGASIYGGIKGRYPLKYEVTVVNGNNRNQVMDNDNGKYFSSRLEVSNPTKLPIKVALNGGVGQAFRNKVYAVGIDLSGIILLNKGWFLEIEAEAKQGNNHTLFYSLDTNKRDGNLMNYQMRGFYILPNLRYVINSHYLKSLEFSCRYEYFDPDFKHAGNFKQVYTPMVSAEFIKTYNFRIQVGANINVYDKDIPASTQYNSQLFILQIQSRF